MLVKEPGIALLLAVDPFMGRAWTCCSWFDRRPIGDLSKIRWCIVSKGLTKSFKVSNDASEAEAPY